MSYFPGQHVRPEMQTLRFEVERIMDRQEVTNLELTLRRNESMDTVVLDMTRRLAVVRRCFEQPGTSETEHGTKKVRVGFHCPASWWDHFKLAHPRLCRFFGDPRMQTVTRVEDVEYDTLHRHYDNVAVVLNDRKELPEAMQTLELRYQVKI